jgi:hypothetical protein
MMKTALALATLAPLALASTNAQAKDMKGRFGIGGQLETLAYGGDPGTPGVPGGLSLKYWIADFGIQAMLGLAANGDNGDTDADESATALGLGLRLLYNFARANDTNLYAGAGVRLGLIDADSTNIDLLLGVEHFFTDFFSVAGHVGLGIEIGDATNITLGNVGTWGTSFHFYF